MVRGLNWEGDLQEPRPWEPGAGEAHLLLLHTGDPALLWYFVKPSLTLPPSAARFPEIPSCWWSLLVCNESSSGELNSIFLQYVYGICQ